MSERYVLAIDFGTQSVRAIVFDNKGNMLAKAKVAFTPYFSKNSGWAEQEPDVYWSNMVEAIRQVREAAPEAFAKVAAVGVTTIRDTVTFVDKAGKPMRPFLVWLDERECSQVEERIPKSKKLIFKLVDMYETVCMQRRVTKGNWVHENEPDIWNNCYKLVQLSGYINFRLTGNLVDSVASQIGHIPFDYKNKRWQGKGDLSACIYDMTADMMIDLKNVGETLGFITPEAAELTGIAEGLPVIACGSDKGCETFGVGVVDEASAAVSLGTTATVQISTKRYVEPYSFVPAYPSVLDGMYNPEVEVFRGFWMVSWFKEEFSHIEMAKSLETGVPAEVYLEELLDKTPPGSDGLVLQPYWSPGIRTSYAKGTIVGFSDVHTRAHLYRAVIEGICFGLYEGMKNLEKRSGVPLTRVMVAGGGSLSDKVCQIAADVFGLPVQRPENYEASALGAAMLTYVGIGEYASTTDAAKNMLRIGKVYEPDAKNHALYTELYGNVYSQIFPSVKHICKNIREFNKKHHQAK